MKALYWKQFGGGPDDELRERMKWVNAKRLYGERKRKQKAN
jgi:hypothetical protein